VPCTLAPVRGRGLWPRGGAAGDVLDAGDVRGTSAGGAARPDVPACPGVLLVGLVGRVRVAGSLVLACSSQAAVRPAAAVTLAERIARVLALRGSPVLAEDIARQLGAPGNLRDRTLLVRAELHGCGAFVEVSRGRWMLGEPGGGPAAPLPLVEVASYLDRVHKDTRRTAVLREVVSVLEAAQRSPSWLLREINSRLSGSGFRYADATMRWGWAGWC
jgi:hypothetical protein